METKACTSPRRSLVRGFARAPARLATSLAVVFAAASLATEAGAQIPLPTLPIALPTLPITLPTLPIALPTLPIGLPGPGATATATTTPTPEATPTAEATPTPEATSTVTETPGTPTPGTPTPTETPTGTPTLAFNPAATPAPGGNVEVISMSDVHTTDGQSVGAGSFQINNTSDMPVIVRRVRIEATDPIVFAQLTLSSSAESVVVSSPSTENTFSFDAGVEIQPRDSLVFTLGADVGEDPSTTSSPTPETTGTVTPTTTTTPTETPSGTVAGVLGGGSRGSPDSRDGGGRFGRALGSIGAGGAIAGLLTALLGIGRRGGRRLAGMALALFGIALYAGCGGEQTSRQTVAEVTAENPLGPVTLTGLPAELGSVSRPQPLIFPGSGGTTGGSGLTTLQ